MKGTLTLHGVNPLCADWTQKGDYPVRAQFGQKLGTVCKKAGRRIFAVAERHFSHMIQNIKHEIQGAKNVMSGRPALIRSRDVKAVIKAARLEGVKQLTVNVGAGSVTIPLVPDDDVPADSNNSFDKIMQKS